MLYVRLTAITILDLWAEHHFLNTLLQTASDYPNKFDYRMHTKMLLDKISQWRIIRWRFEAPWEFVEVDEDHL